MREEGLSCPGEGSGGRYRAGGEKPKLSRGCWSPLLRGANFSRALSSRERPAARGGRRLEGRYPEVRKRRNDLVFPNEPNSPPKTRYRSGHDAVSSVRPRARRAGGTQVTQVEVSTGNSSLSRQFKISLPGNQLKLTFSLNLFEYWKRVRMDDHKRDTRH